MRINAECPNPHNFVILLEGIVQGMCYEADEDEGWCKVFDVDSYLKEVKQKGQAHSPSHIKTLTGKVEIKLITPELKDVVYAVVREKLLKLKNS